MDADRELLVRAEARIGTVLKGKYRVDSVLGVGGMAVVYVVTHRNQKRFALKILHPEISIRADIRQRFLREGYAANSLQHPGAVAILDDDVDDEGAAFLVMELLEGSSVEGLWERMPRMPPSAVLCIAHQLLDALAAAHAKSIVHRDIKPANLFIQHDGTLKILDFGIARVRDASAGVSATSSGAMLGTPAFMAPEQALGKTSEIDGATDLWAVGATMFSLLSGKLVHSGDNASQLMIMAATQKAPSLATAVPDAPPAIVEVVDRALAFSRADRWPSAAAMRDAVAAAHQAACGGPVSKAPLVVLMEERARLSSEQHVAHAPTVQAAAVGPGTGDAASGPTLPAPASSYPRRPGGTTSQPVSSSPSNPADAPTASSRKANRVVLALVGVITVGATAALVAPKLRSGATPASTAAATPPATGMPASSSSAPAPSTATSAVALPTPLARLAVSPPTASVEVDGKPAPVAGGAVDVPGAPGSMHMVHVTAGKRDSTFPVLLTEAGPVPPKVELAVASPPAAGGVAPRPPGAATGAQPAAPAPTGSFSRKME